MSDFEDLCAMMGQRADDPDAIDNMIEQMSASEEAVERTFAVQRQLQNVVNWFPEVENFTGVDQELFDIVIEAKRKIIALRNTCR